MRDMYEEILKKTVYIVLKVLPQLHQQALQTMNYKAHMIMLIE